VVITEFIGKVHTSESFIFYYPDMKMVKDNKIHFSLLPLWRMECNKTSIHSCLGH